MSRKTEGRDAKSNSVRTGRWRVSRHAKSGWGDEENIATGDSGAGDHPADGEHHFDSDRKCGRADAVRAGDGGCAARGNSLDQSTEGGAKTLDSDTIS